MTSVQLMAQADEAGTYGHQKAEHRDSPHSPG
jgi:hypothetical protein